MRTRRHRYGPESAVDAGMVVVKKGQGMIVNPGDDPRLYRLAIDPVRNVVAPSVLGTLTINAVRSIFEREIARTDLQREIPGVMRFERPIHTHSPQTVLSWGPLFSRRKFQTRAIPRPGASPPIAHATRRLIEYDSVS